MRDTPYPAAAYATLLLLLLQCGCTEGRTFRVAYLFAQNISDMAWNHMLNKGRIKAHQMVVPLLTDGDTLDDRFYEGVGPDVSAAKIDELARSGVNLIIATSFSFQGIIFDAAGRHPGTDFAHLPGQDTGRPNFFSGSVRVEQSVYAAGILAGSHSRTKRLGVIAAYPIGGVNLGISLLYIGAQRGAGGVVNATHVEHRVEVFIIWVYTFDDVDLELEAGMRLVTLGCDVLVHTSNNLNIDFYAKGAGVMSIGVYGDMRTIVGDSILISQSLDYSQLFSRVLMLAYNGSLRHPSTDRSPPWYGFVEGGPTLHEASVHVPGEASDQVRDVVKAMASGAFDPVCHPLISGGVVSNPGRCLTPQEIRYFGFVVDGPVALESRLVLPGELCGNGSFFTAHADPTVPRYDVACHPCPPGQSAVLRREGHKACTVCPAGTASAHAGAWNCTPCPQRFFSAEGAVGCTACPDGTTNLGVGNIHCPVDDSSTDLTVVIAVACAVGGFMLQAALPVAVKLYRNRVEMERLYSETAVARRCAACIADMRLEDVDYIRRIEKPSAIIASLTVIMDHLVEYRTYLPQTLIEERLNEDIASESSSSNPESTESGNVAAEDSSTLTKLSTNSAWKLIGTSLVSRRITLVLANIVGFLQLLKQERVSLQTHQCVTNAMLHVFDKTNGTSEGFLGDRFSATYNTVKRLGDHAAAGCLALVMIRQAAEKLGVAMSSSAASGHVRAGTLGCVRMKRYCFLGPVVAWAAALERYSKKAGLPHVVSESMRCQAIPQFEMWAVGAMCLRKYSDGPEMAYVITKHHESSNEEWMYQLAEMQESLQLNGAWNRWASAVIAGEWQKAQGLWESVQACVPEFPFGDCLVKWFKACDACVPHVDDYF